LIVEYYASYTEIVKPGADGNISELFPKINKKVEWLKVKSQRLPSVLKEVEMSRLFSGSTLYVFGLALNPKASLNAWERSLSLGLLCSVEISQQGLT